MLLRGPHFEYAGLISKVLLDVRNEETLKAVREGVQRSPMKSKRSVE
jgi:hypothetical protein